jgi:hypothetical protein
VPPRDHFEGTPEQITGLFVELTNASDRVAAIACAAFLDDSIGVALLTRFISIGAKWKDKIFTGPNSPLGTFYSKAVVGYALGLFGPKTYSDLDVIRKIRNDFAHTPTPLRFEDEKIAKLCRQLTTTIDFSGGLGILFPGNDSPKAVYVQSAFQISTHLLRGKSDKMP